MKRHILAVLLLLAAGSAAAQKEEGNLMFNEVMQSNIDYLLVEKDFPDSWVELYNPTAQDINLGRYWIGEHADQRGAYQFPAGVGMVPAGGHLVVYCDKEARGLHASFRVDSGKASLYLFNPSGEVVDSLILAKMPAPNIAYGRVTDGAGEWQYEVTPTAGTPNNSVGAAMVLPEPAFSELGGVCRDPISLTLSVPEVEGLPEDTKLYYTLDGSEPTMASSCTDQSQTLSVSRTTVVRAKLMSAKALSPVSSVQSYIFHPRETSLPVVSIVTDNDYIFGSEMGIASGNVNDGKPNYMQKWRRPLNIEYYDMRQGGKMVFNQLGETAVSGVSTREQPQKSFKIYANKRFGKKTYKGDFWTDKPEVTKVKSFVLRSGGNNSFTTRINDALVQRVFGLHVENLDWQAYQPVIVYINGTYQGEFGMRERSNEDFVEANYGLEEVEMADETSYQTPDRNSLFADFQKAYSKSTTTYEELDGMMDMDNFCNALIAETYAMNTDFPTNNVSMWRLLENASDAQEEIEGGESKLGDKWRWVLKDLDRAGMNIALYPSTFDMFNYLFNPDDLMYGGMHHFDLYKKMSTLPTFTEAFTNRFLVYLGDFLKPSLVNAMADSMSNEIYSELKYTFAAYNCSTEWSRYKQNMKDLKEFFASRPMNLYGQMAAYFGLGNVHTMTVENALGTVSINGQKLTEGDFDGACFATRKVTLDSGDETKGWKLTVTPRQGEPREYTFDTSCVELLPSDYLTAAKDKWAFETIQLEVEQEPDHIAVSRLSSGDAQAYTLTGIRLSKPQRGLNIVNRNGKIMKVMRL